MAESWDELIERQARERREHPTRESRRGLQERFRRDLEELEFAERQEGMAQARQRRIDAEAAEARKNRQILEDRIDAQAAAMHPSQVLNDLRALGVTVEANDTGVITVSPPGLLSPVHRKVIASRRAEVVAMIRAAQQSERL